MHYVIMYALSLCELSLVGWREEGGGRVHSLQIRSATFEIGVTWKVDGITRERERVRKN